MSNQRVETTSETWRAVIEEIEAELKTSRKRREDPSRDLRHLDQDLGRIKQLEHLLALPERQAKKAAEPIRGSGVRVPGMNHSLNKARNK